MSKRYTFIIKRADFVAQIEVLHPPTVACLQDEPERAKVAETFLRVGICAAFMIAFGSSEDRARALESHLKLALEFLPERTGEPE